MSGTLPTAPLVRSVSISSASPTFVSLTHSGRVVSRTRAGHKWLLTLHYPVMTRATFAPLWAFLVTQAGRDESFFYALAEHGIQGTGGTPGTPEVAGAHSIGDTTIDTDGWNNAETVLKAGDLIRFAGSQKIYMVEVDALTDGAGLVTISIFPGLRVALVDNQDVKVTGNPRFTVSLASDIFAIDVDQCLLYGGMSIDLVERA